MLSRISATFLFLAATSWACLNTPGTSLDGLESGSRYSHDVRTLRESMRLSGPNPANLRLGKPPATPAQQLERKALELIYAGDYAAARPLLEKAEADGGGDYSIAANLGTVCELLGDNAAALRWITEAMRRNPDSHRGTEWVHVLVLNAKVSDAARPTSAPRPPLLEIPEHVAENTVLTIAGVDRTAREVRASIVYQLRERMMFVKPKDRYVADLLFTLARLNAHLVNIEASGGVLTLAEEYGYADAARIEALREDLADARLKASLYTGAYWLAGVGALGGFLGFAYRRKWFFLSRAACHAHRASTRGRPPVRNNEPAAPEKTPAPKVETCER